MSDLVRREIMKPGGITMLHRDLLREVYWFRDELEKAAVKGPAPGHAANPLEGRDLARTVDVLKSLEFYSRAVQVFALMAVEALLNTYGLLRFARQGFQEKAANEGPATKVQPGREI